MLRDRMHLLIWFLVCMVFMIVLVWYGEYVDHKDPDDMVLAMVAWDGSMGGDIVYVMERMSAMDGKVIMLDPLLDMDTRRFVGELAFKISGGDGELDPYEKFLMEGIFVEGIDVVGEIEDYNSMFGVICPRYRLKEFNTSRRDFPRLGEVDLNLRTLDSGTAERMFDLYREVRLEAFDIYCVGDDGDLATGLNVDVDSLVLFVGDEGYDMTVIHPGDELILNDRGRNIYEDLWLFDQLFLENKIVDIDVTFYLFMGENDYFLAGDGLNYMDGILDMCVLVVDDTVDVDSLPEELSSIDRRIQISFENLTSEALKLQLGD